MNKTGNQVRVIMNDLTELLRVTRRDQMTKFRSSQMRRKMRRSVGGRHNVDSSKRLFVLFSSRD